MWNHIHSMQKFSVWTESHLKSYWKAKQTTNFVQCIDSKRHQQIIFPVIVLQLRWNWIECKRVSDDNDKSTSKHRPEYMRSFWCWSKSTASRLQTKSLVWCIKNWFSNLLLCDLFFFFSLFFFLRYLRWHFLDGLKFDNVSVNMQSDDLYFV